jgi:hypothetical protein
MAAFTPLPIKNPFTIAKPDKDEEGKTDFSKIFQPVKMILL